MSANGVTSLRGPCLYRRCRLVKKLESRDSHLTEIHTHAWTVNLEIAVPREEEHFTRRDISELNSLLTTVSIKYQTEAFLHE